MFQLQNVKELTRWNHDSTLSLYLNVNPAVAENQAAHPAWHTWAKNALRNLEKGLQPEQAAVWSSIRARVERYLDELMPNSKALALFFASESERIYELTFPVENRAAFGKPLLTPLLSAMDEYRAYLVVMVDHEKAHFITAYLGGADHQETAKLELDTSDWTHKSFQSTSNYASKTVQSNAHDDYEQRVELYQERFHEEVAKRAAELMNEYDARYIVIGGDEQAAHAVHRHIPDKTAQAVIGVKALPMRYSPHEVLQHVLPLVRDYERQQEMELVEQVINMAKAGGRASVGREAVLHSVDQQRVELLIAPWPMPDEHLAQELPFRVLTSGGEIELVHGAAAERLMAEGGLAARLYYAPKMP
jgi:release factor family 10